jgi:hypothetical protein
MSDEYVGLIRTPVVNPKIGDMPMRAADGTWTTLPIATPSSVDMMLAIDPTTGLPTWVPGRILP